jgi:hypothetical protein
VMKISGRAILLAVASGGWKVRIRRGSGSHFSAIVILRTAIDDNTVIDSTAVTFGSSATPTMSAGMNTSDPISLALDVNHDYYVIGYNDSGDSSFWGYKPAQAQQGTNNYVVGSYQSGDHTSDTSVSGLISATGFGCPWDLSITA